MTRPMLHHDDGFSLLELSIATLILGFILAMLGTALLMMQRTERATAADTESLTTLRFARDNIERDVREADEILAGTSKTALRLWLDANDNGTIDTDETVVWSFESAPAGGVDLVRTLEDSGDRFIAGERLVNPSGTYEPFTDGGATPDPSTRLLTIELWADSELGIGETESVTTRVHLRNKV